MTDAAQWPPPSGPSDAPDRDVVAPAPPAPPAAWSSTGSWQQPGPASGPAPAWTPPPRPGLIPLRPLGFGTLLGAPFQVLRRSPRTTLGVALLVQGVGSVLALVIYGVVAVLAVGRVEQADAADQDAVGAGALAVVILAALIPLAVALATGALVQGVVVLEVSRGVLGERPTLRQLLGRLRGRFWALVGWTVLQGVGTALLVAAAVALAVPLFLLGAQNGGAGTIVGGVLVLIVAGLAAAALGVWIGTKLALVPSILVVERLPIRRAVGRSWSLVVGGFWRTFGALALMLVIVQAASQVVATPLSLLVPIGGALIAPTDPDAQIVTSLIVALLSVAVGLVIGAVGTVLQSAVTGLVYLDRRMRREGFDLVLLRHVEDRAAGRPTPDPFPAPERAPPVIPGLLAGAPLDPDSQEARRLLLEELADPRYRAAEPTWFDRTVQAIRDWFFSLSVPTDGAGVPVAAVIGVAVLLALVVAALLIAGAPKRRRRSTITGAVLADDDGRSADSIRTLAEAAAARGDFDEALVERFRALVRALDERTLVSHSPGTTAHGFARRASAAFPGSADALRAGADDFDRVRYLGRHCGAPEYERLRDLDRALAAATPDLGGAVDPLASLAPRR